MGSGINLSKIFVQADFKEFNMYHRGISLEGDVPNQSMPNVMLTLKYDLAPRSWKKSAPGPNSENLTIYHVSPNIYAYQRINSIGDCCVDCSCTTIKGTIGSCGFYVIGEK